MLICVLPNLATYWLHAVTMISPRPLLSFREGPSLIEVSLSGEEPSFKTLDLVFHFIYFDLYFYTDYFICATLFLF